MAAKFERGQRVVVKDIKNQLSLRDSTLELYAGQIGIVKDIYNMTLSRGNIIYLYTVKLDSDRGEVVLHEDELLAYRV